MRTYKIRDWLKTLNVAEHYYSGKIDREKEKAVCVYDDRNKDPYDIAFGGYDQTTTFTYKASLVLQWNKNPRESEDAGYDLIDKLKQYENGGFYIGDCFVEYLEVKSHPLYNGVNENGICERVIWFDITYSK